MLGEGEGREDDGSDDVAMILEKLRRSEEDQYEEAGLVVWICGHSRRCAGECLAVKGGQSSESARCVEKESALGFRVWGSGVGPQPMDPNTLAPGDLVA